MTTTNRIDNLVKILELANKEGVAGREILLEEERAYNTHKHLTGTLKELTGLAYQDCMRARLDYVNHQCRQKIEELKNGIVH